MGGLRCAIAGGLVLTMLGCATAPPSESQAGLEPAEVNEQPVLTRVHSLPASLEPQLPAIVEQIRSEITPGGWDESSQSIRVEGPTLVVRTTPDRHARILRYLDALQAR